ncbi:MAG: phospholipase D-like domain-containing protein [Candidatus Paceibacterota bacterium]|jgi:cardiolipin synthase
MKFNLKKLLKRYKSGNKVLLVKSGEEYFSVLKKIIIEAKNEIHFQTYILSDDSTGRMIVDELIDAKKRGVEVYLLIDSYGSRNLSKNFTKQIIDSGIHFRYFAPVITSKGFCLGRRLHQKIVVIDSKIALIGGINIADRYMGTEDKKPWLDFALLIKGKICEDVSNICDSFWERKFLNKKRKNNIKQLTDKVYPLLRIRQNDWMREKNQISRSYKNAFKNAEKYITIVGAYFLPSRKLRYLIKKAVDRGVKVKIILSKKSDERVFQLAMDYLYRWMHRNNIEIYEYHPSVVHGKATVVDDTWLTIGSHDLNFLSTYGLIEMNIDVLDVSLAEEFNSYLENIIQKDCIKITTEHLEKKWIFEKFLSWFTYVLVRISELFLIFLSRNDKNNE